MDPKTQDRIKPQVRFNVATTTGDELDYLEKVVQSGQYSGNGEWTNKCMDILREKFKFKHVVMTTSATDGLELSALLAGIQHGDEVIMPSFTFTSTANAFQIFGAKIKFIDIRSDTCNMDENLIEAAITSKTKAIVPVHYGAVGAEMDVICDIGAHYKIPVIADAAQGVNAFYKGKALGTIGDMGIYSFHDTKNFNAGEGGALITNNDEYALRASILRDKGTNREQFLNGMVDKYTWVDFGSSYLPSELNTALLYPQLLQIDQLTDQRLALWGRYFNNLKQLENAEKLTRQFVPDYCKHNGHMFYIKLHDLQSRQSLAKFLRANGIESAFHYAPLHTSPHGIATTEFIGDDKYTTKTFEQLLRLPMHNALTFEQVDYVCENIERWTKLD